MTANANSSRLFQFYMDSFFKFPKDIRNDMIYCQRALRDHIKVHQMVLDVFEQQPNKDPVHRNRILDEIESEIYEINAEQQFLFLRLRRVIDEFYKMLKKNNIPVEQNKTNNLISREVVPYIKHGLLKVQPVAVQTRLNEDMLIQKYFEVQQDEPKISIENGCEIIDLCDNDDLEVIEVPLENSSPKTTKIKKELIDNKYQLTQMSLLKPIDQRILVNSVSGETSNSTDCYVDNPSDDSCKIVKLDDEADAVVVNSDIDNIKNQEIEASKSVKLSRLNLRQALKRAHTENLNSRVVGTQTASGNEHGKNTGNDGKQKDKILKSPTSSNGQTVDLVNGRSLSTSPPSKNQKHQSDTKPRTTRAATLAAATALAESKTAEILSTSSDDSNIERDPTSPHPFWPDEMIETRTIPAEYGQEMFLRLFGLFTPEMHIHMQQRRSKRKRRPVQSNERSDYHYGRIEQYGNLPTAKDQKKERKTFLLSPQAKAKKPKRGSAEKIEEPVISSTSRSNSSSPNEKHNCNECLKSLGILEVCGQCKAYYHQLCHRDDDEELKTNNLKKNVTAAADTDKLCPACKRKQMKLIKKEKLQNKTLNDAAKDLEVKMALQRDRRAKLQNASKMYKLQMLNLFNIVKKIKSDKDNDNDSTEE